jgi:hypothetical protein
MLTRHRFPALLPTPFALVLLLLALTGCSSRGSSEQTEIIGRWRTVAGEEVQFILEAGGECTWMDSRGEHLGIWKQENGTLRLKYPGQEFVGTWKRSQNRLVLIFPDQGRTWHFQAM